MKFFQRTGFGESKTYFGGKSYIPYMMGLGQGNRAAPPSWIQLSAVCYYCHIQQGYLGYPSTYLTSYDLTGKSPIK